MPCFAGPTMALDEANALVKALLDEETQPERRAKLVALQLALGWPHALEVEPEHLAELRTAERACDALKSQAWLATASAAALTWCSSVSVLLGMFGGLRESLARGAFAIGALHAVMGFCCAWVRPERRSLSVLTWAWLCGPAFAFAQGLSSEGALGLVALLCATPSMLVSLAASRVARHTAAR